jgi:4'-phosphopantetheinyl transferase EntD
MPLIRLQKINGDSWMGMWRVEEEVGWFFGDLDMSIEDTDALGKITNHYKKLEWLSTRSLMQELTSKIGINYPGIVKDEHGKPHLNNHAHPISVTHSYPYVAAIVHLNKEVGIDLEKLKTDKILRIAPKFMSESEYAFSDQDPHISTLIWCAKESLYKLHGRKFVIFKEDLEIEPFEMAESGELTGHIRLPDLKGQFKLNYETTENFFITYTVC